MSTKIQVKWRRRRVFDFSSKGYYQTQIANILQMSESTISRQQFKENIKKYVDERLPEEYEKCLVGLTAITKEAWNTAHDPEYKREKIQALSLAKECYSMNMDLLTNATVVDDAIRFVSSQKSKDKEELKSAISEGDKEESNEPDYDEDQDQLEEEQEEETREATNQVF